MKPSMWRESRAWLPWEKWYENGAKPARPVDMGVTFQGGNEVTKTINELRDDNAMLRFQVEQLWKDCKDYRTRLSQAMHTKRESSRIKQGIIDELKAENARMKERLGPPMPVDVTSHDAVRGRVIGEDGYVQFLEKQEDIDLAIGLLRSVVIQGAPIPLRDPDARMVPAVVMWDIARFLRELEEHE